MANGFSKGAWRRVAAAAPGVILAVVAAAGCGSGVVAATAAAVDGPLPEVKVSSAAQMRIGSVTNFGDSITSGAGALPADGTGYVYSTKGYAGLLDAAIGKPALNVGRAGDQAADMTRGLVYPTASPTLTAGQLYTVMIGTNDAVHCGAAGRCLSQWSQALASSLAWLALPASDKTLGTAIQGRSAGWSTDGAFGIGVATTSHGANLTFPVEQTVAGRSLYVAYRVFDANVKTAGMASLTVDGVLMASMNAAVSAAQPLLTQNGTSDTVFVQKVALGAVGRHTVSVTTTSAEGAYFSVLWAGVASGTYASVEGAPRVVISPVPTSADKNLNITIGTYNSMLQTLVSSFAEEGLNIQLTPTVKLNAASEFADGLHPNNNGHIRLAAAFASAL